MTVNVVMLVHERYTLTNQAIDSLYVNTDQDQFNLTVVDDESQDFRVGRYLSGLEGYRSIITLDGSRHILSRMKNLGVRWSESHFGRADYLCVCDNDVYFLPQWLARMVEAYSSDMGLRLLGGERHPYHGINKFNSYVEFVDAVAGYTHFMSWNTWRGGAGMQAFGPYDETTAPGVCQGEDQAFCRKIVDAGYEIGYTSPPTILHTGVTNSKGEPAVGAEHFARHPGVIYL